VINFKDFPLRREHRGELWANASEKRRKEWLREGVVPLDYRSPVAADWPDLLAVVESRVKPERDRLRGNPDAEHRKKFYWQWGRYTPTLERALIDHTSVCVRSLTSTQYSFAFVPSSIVHDQTLIVFTEAAMSDWAVLSSRVHESWATFFGATFKDDPRYNVGRCYETFPFPASYKNNLAVQASGQSYYDFRADLMVRNNAGLTKTYNRFHRPDEYSPDILKLRELHDAMDRAVLDAYGWHDLQPKCDCFPEFDEEDGDDDAESTRPRQKRYRYRWPDEIHDEVLARLLALNRERAGHPAVVESPPPSGPKKTAQRKKGSVHEDQAALY
jgi:hypothetical protein